MAPRPIQHVVLDELPRVSQKLRLICLKCGGKGLYDVGSVFYDREGDQKDVQYRYSFTKYFRCRECDSPGPWELVDQLRLLGIALNLAMRRESPKFLPGRLALFDGTFIQTPAIGEDLLLKLIHQDPGNAFLCTRLGNLLRGAGQESRASEWYEKALRLDPGDIEARYHLQ